MNGKELVWLSKDVAEQLKTMEDDLSTGEIIQRYIAQTKRDVELSVDALDDDLLNLKSWSIKVKKEFKEVYQAQVEESESLFLDAESKLPQVHKIAKTYCNELAPVIKDLEKIKNLQDVINKWDIERMHEMVTSIHRMVNDEKLLPMMELLIKTFK